MERDWLRKSATASMKSNDLIRTRYVSGCVSFLCSRRAFSSMEMFSKWAKAITPAAMKISSNLNAMSNCFTTLLQHAKTNNPQAAMHVMLIPIPAEKDQRFPRRTSFVKHSIEMAPASKTPEKKRQTNRPIPHLQGAGEKRTGYTKRGGWHRQNQSPPSRWPQAEKTFHA